jgi:Rps23 Pro-64 3,4-dihydroxylase Tpa1-like proline 4-hydroxylase
MILRERFGMLAPRLTRELGLAPFEVADIEFDVVVYNDGSFYGPHIDIAAGPLRRARADRIVTAVYYFHAEPKAFAGGELRLHALGTAQDGSRPHVDIEPVQNSLVAFAASTLHEVRPISCLSGQYRDSRFAINCWIRRARTEGPSHK